MATEIDGILVQWGDRLFYPGNRRGRSTSSVRVSGEQRHRAAEIRRRINATVVCRDAVARASIIDWPELADHPALGDGQGGLVVFGCFSSHTVARQINASPRSKVNNGNVAYVSALTIVETPEQYQDIKMLLGFGERGADTYTYRAARKLALPVRCADKDPWAEELD